ncbi:MFS general substrate transporter-21 [Venturia nashicola]|nr:MFS general substrate transporter-21 [Venturia nashicola]
MFKPNISPTLLDQMPVTIPVAKTLASGEKVIVDPEATTERVMLWFYLLINIGGMFSTPTTYIEKYHGFWLAYFIPTILYMGLLPMLMYLKKRLVLKPAGGSDLGKVVQILGICFKRGGALKMFRGDFFAAAKPSVIATSSNPIQVPWTDGFVEDVRHAFQATGIFCFFPIQMINDNGLGEAANFLSTMLKGDGVPNDVMNNFNSLIIIISIPIMNYGVYPWLRRKRIKFGSVAQITTGFAIATLGGFGYTIINHYAYKTGPCKEYGSSMEKCVDGGLVAPISLWWMALPYALGGLSEIFVNVPAFGIAYSRSPPNMRGLVSAINLFSSAISYAIGLMFTGVVKDPYLTWVFGVPTAIGAISTVAFWFMYKNLDEEEFSLVSASELEEKEHTH